MNNITVWSQEDVYFQIIIDKIIEGKTDMSEECGLSMEEQKVTGTTTSGTEVTVTIPLRLRALLNEDENKFSNRGFLRKDGIGTYSYEVLYTSWGEEGDYCRGGFSVQMDGEPITFDRYEAKALKDALDQYLKVQKEGNEFFKYKHEFKKRVIV